MFSRMICVLFGHKRSVLFERYGIAIVNSCIDKVVPGHRIHVLVFPCERCETLFAEFGLEAVGAVTQEPGIVGVDDV